LIYDVSNIMFCRGARVRVSKNTDKLGWKEGITKNKGSLPWMQLVQLPLHVSAFACAHLLWSYAGAKVHDNVPRRRGDI
jgi:hypothetical protein